MGAALREHRGYGPRDDLDVRGDRRVRQVAPVVLDALVVSDVTAAADLPEAGETGPCRQIGVLAAAGAVLLELALDDRSRADEAHVALDHVDQLRQLVETRPAKHLSEAGHSGIII